MDFSRILKGQVIQTAVATLLRTAGYRVSPFGIEDRLTGIKELDYPQYEALRLPAHARCAPDLLVIDPDTHNPIQLEVKYRSKLDDVSATLLAEKLVSQRIHWPDSFAIIVVGSGLRSLKTTVHHDFMRVVAPGGHLLLASKARIEDRWLSLLMIQKVFHRFKVIDSQDNQRIANMMAQFIEHFGAFESVK